MKKFLIAIIFLIPVMVIIAIQGTSMAIDAWAPAVNAESVEIRDEFNDNIGGGRVVIPRYWSDGSDGFAYVYINVYPKVSYSDEVLYAVSDEDGYDGECILERVEKTKYKITAKKRGDVLLKIYSVTNDNAYKNLNIYITSEVITDLSIYADNSQDITKVDESDEIAFSENLRLFAHAYPGEAIGNNFIQWEAQDEKIACIDENGRVSAKGIGRTKITATVKDKTGKEHFTFIYVDVQQDFVLSSSNIHIEKLFFTTNLSEQERVEFILENIVIQNEENPIEEEDVSFVSSSNAQMVYHVSGSTLTINFVDFDEIEIVSDYLKDIYIENGGYTVITKYKDFRRKEKPSVRYHLSDSSVLTFSGNRIMPIKEGATSVYAENTVTGKKSNTINLNVMRRIISFQLNSTNFDNLRGIKQERVWGNYWFDESNNLTNKFKLGYDNNSVHPKTENVDLLWEIDNTEVAEIDNEGTITFLDGCEGEKITMTATVVVHGIKTKLSRSYIFLMAEKSGAINVSDLEQFELASSEQMGKSAVALQSDITIYWERQIYANNNIYGNGYLINFIFPDEEFRYSNALVVSKNSINANITDIVLENFTIQCDDNFEKGQYKASAVRFEDIEIPSTIRYVISRYAWISVNVSCNKSVTTIEGCILGNVGFAAIYIDNEYYMNDDDPKSTIIIRNVVMKETGCASIVTAPYSMQTDVIKNYVPNIILEGFIDSYNWKKIDELQGIFNAVDPGALGDLQKGRDLFSKVLGDLLESLLQEEPYRKMVYTDSDGQKWVGMNMFAVGLSEYIDPESFDVSNSGELEVMPVALDKGTQWLLKKLLNFDMGYPCYMMTYKFDETKGPAIKPQDVCPENELLFTRLRSENGAQE